MVDILNANAFSHMSSFLTYNDIQNMCSTNGNLRKLGLEAGGWITKTQWGTHTKNTYKNFVSHCAHKSLRCVQFSGLENPEIWLPRWVNKVELKRCTLRGRAIEDGTYTVKNKKNGPWAIALPESLTFGRASPTLRSALPESLRSAFNYLE